MDNSTLPWIEKYRPDKLDNMVSHIGIIKILNNMIDNNKFPHIILYGPPGTGKTSLIMSCAKKIYGDNFNSIILELNGSDDRGINVVREQIKEFSCTQPMLNKIYGNSNKYKLVILDEADSMTYDAQFALRRVIENYSVYTRFCLICNYLNKIDMAIQSRCTIFKLGPIEKSLHISHIKKIANLENFNITDDCILNIVELSEGDMRKSINILQSLYMSYNDNLTTNSLYISLGYPLPNENIEMLNYVLDQKIDIKETYNKLLFYIDEKNISINDIIKEFTKLLIKKVNLSNQNLAIILHNLANIENRLINNISTEIQLGAIITTIKYPSYL